MNNEDTAVLIILKIKKMVFMLMLVAIIQHIETIHTYCISKTGKV